MTWWNWEKFEMAKKTVRMFVASSMLFFPSSRKTRERAPISGSCISRDSKSSVLLASSAIFPVASTFSSTLSYMHSR